MSYIAILLLILVATIFLEITFHPHPFDSLKERLVWTLIVFIIGVAWDIYAVAHQQWAFPGNGLLGINIGILPIEEYFFFLIPPYFALTLATIIRERMK